MKKYIFLFAAIVALGAGAYYSELRFLSYSHSPASASSAIQGTQTASLTVGERSYSIPVSPNETVMDAMRALEKLGDFVFGGKEYPGMGFFVASINGLPAQAGKKNSDGMYWILYINGKTADAGASQTEVKPGDKIEWRYEENY